MTKHITKHIHFSVSTECYFLSKFKSGGLKKEKKEFISGQEVTKKDATIATKYRLTNRKLKQYSEYVIHANGKIKKWVSGSLEDQLLHGDGEKILPAWAIIWNRLGAPTIFRALIYKWILSQR